MSLTVGSLFSGIGGIDLGLERAGMDVRWQSEVDPYASRVLAKHWPSVPNHGDITQIDFRQVEPVDVLAGGFPCQDISSAGNKEGIAGAKSGLWSHYARAIGCIRPLYVFVENVAALRVRGLDVVLSDLAALGYDAEWDCIPASAVGAPQRRDRLYLIAHDADRYRARFLHDAKRYRDPAARRRLQARVHAHGLRDVMPGAGHMADLLGKGSTAAKEWLSRESGLARVADGVPDRLDRTRALGNAVVPAVAELIGGWIVAHAERSAVVQEAA